MNNDKTKKYINTNPHQYFRKTGKKGYICPLCGGGSDGKTTGLSLDSSDETKTHYKCFNCGEHGDVLHFISKKFQLSNQKDILTKACEIYCMRDDAYINEETPKQSAGQQKFVIDKYPKKTNLHELLGRIDECVNGTRKPIKINCLKCGAEVYSYSGEYDSRVVSCCELKYDIIIENYEVKSMNVSPDKMFSL